MTENFSLKALVREKLATLIIKSRMNVSVLLLALCVIYEWIDKIYCHMVYYIKNWEAIFDAFKKFVKLTENCVQ